MTRSPQLERTRHPRRMLPWSLAMALAGCTSLPTEDTTATLESPEPPVEAGSPTIPTEPVASADAAPEASPAPAGGLHVIARAGTDLQLHPLVDGSLLVSAGPLVLRVDDQGELVYDPAMLRGIESPRPTMIADDYELEGIGAWWAVSLGGRWPDAVYLSLDVASGFRGEGGVPVVSRWSGDRWEPLHTRGKHHEHYPAELHPWKDGSILARRVFVPRYPGQEKWQGEDGGPTLRQIATTTKAIAAAKQLVVIRGTPKAPDVAPTVAVFDSRETGEIFAVTEEDLPTLVRIDAAGARTTIPLASRDVEPRGVLADGPDRAWVFGVSLGGDAHRPWLVRVEGERATEVEGPACATSGLASFVVLESGAQWATCGLPYDMPFFYEEQELWHRPAGGAWARQALPPGVRMPKRVVARGDEVWVNADAEDGSVLLASRPRATVLELPTLAELGRLRLEWNDPAPVSEHCHTAYVPLRSPPAQADAVKAALDGPMRALKLTTYAVTLVSTTVRGKAQLGLQLGAFEDRRDAQRVAAVARKALGKDAVEDPRCWFAKEAPDAGLATWETHR